MWSHLLILLAFMSLALGEWVRCNQTLPGATVTTPSDPKDMPFELSLITKGTVGKYVSLQTYVLILETKNNTRPFREFMITVEDPAVDNITYSQEQKEVDVGTLKTRDNKVDGNKARYSERCDSTIENNDYSDKYRIETHWVSPKQSVNKQKIRFRAMVAENKEVWYEELTVVLEKDDAKAIDSPPLPVSEVCDICSEARYEIIFHGHWSRSSHPRHYPTKPDENYYSHVIGASHALDYTLWQQGSPASPGLKDLAKDANITRIEREIIDAMSEEGGTRTLIRGKRRHHPYMSEPTQALLRVDRVHHMFSIAVAMRPSPDWFLGTTRFELCNKTEWLPHAKIPLFPWDAGTVNGISYESVRSMTQPEDTVNRVAVGSFQQDSPFFQMNLNDLTPFATLTVRRLDVYPLADCNNEEAEGESAQAEAEEDEDNEEPHDEPLTLESRQKAKCLSEWSEWSHCVPAQGDCGIGSRVRVRQRGEENSYSFYNTAEMEVKPLQKCEDYEEGPLLDSKHCFINCYN